jgi:hypothetical protein
MCIVDCGNMEESFQNNTSDYGGKVMKRIFAGLIFAMAMLAAVALAIVPVFWFWAAFDFAGESSFLHTVYFGVSVAWMYTVSMVVSGIIKKTIK